MFFRDQIEATFETDTIIETKNINDESFYTIENLFKSRPYMTTNIVEQWTENITVEEDPWIYTNIAYKLQTLGYLIPPDRIYKNKTDLLAICG